MFTVLTEMAKRGYTVEWKVYNSKDYGVPQNRERVYIVGYLGNGSGKPLLPKPRKNTNVVKQLGNIRNTTSFGGNPQSGRVYSESGCSPCLNTCQGGGREPKILTKRFIDLNKGVTKCTDNARSLIARYTAGITNHKGVNSGVLITDATVVRPCLTPDRLQKRQNGRRFKENGEPAFTVNTQDRHGLLIKTNESRDDLGVTMPDGSKCYIRKLTPRECWRLQGFTDEQFDKAASVNSNSQLYKQAGNAVTVNVTYEIGKHIVDYIKNDEER